MTLSKSKIFLILCLSFILGIFLGKYSNLEIMALMAMIFIITLALNWSNRNWMIIGFAGLFVVLGMWRFMSSTSEIIPKNYFGRTASISGVILQEPDQRSDKTLLTIGNLSINNQKAMGNLLITIARIPEHNYGEELNFTGKIQEPKDAEVKGEFSYRDYLSRYNIWGLVYYPKNIESEFGKANAFKYYLLKVKQKFVATIAQLLPEPQNSFLAGLLVGLRRGIPKDLTEWFNITGTTHIIAISGFNITIIAQSLEKLFQRFGRRISFGIALVAIVMFVILSGASASVVRAGIMGVLGLIALNIGRMRAITNALVFTASVMLFINPKILHFDVGFQLSFLALLGLVYLSPLLEPFFSKVPKVINKFLIPTIAAQIFTLPILLYNFDRLSLVAIITNILILPLIPLSMGVGFFAGILGMIHLYLGQPLAWFVWVILAYIIKVTKFFASLPLAQVTMQNFPIWGVVVYYVLLVLIILRATYPDMFIWKKPQKNF